VLDTGFGRTVGAVAHGLPVSGGRRTPTMADPSRPG
jgi:hypothetical protein